MQLNRLTPQISRQPLQRQGEGNGISFFFRKVDVEPFVNLSLEECEQRLRECDLRQGIKQADEVVQSLMKRMQQLGKSNDYISE